MEEYSFQVRRVAGRRRLSITVRPDGSFWVSTNKTLSQKRIRSFLLEQMNWVRSSAETMDALRAQNPKKQFQSGEIYPYLGNNYELVIQESRPLRLQIQDGKMIFSSPISEKKMSGEQRRYYQQKFQNTYKKVAKKVLTTRLEYWSERMGLQAQGLSFRMQKSVWGSCSSTNKISLNMKLIVAPLEILDYVVIHELAHILHKNHSRAFWNVVETYTRHRHLAAKWLRDNVYLADFLGPKSDLHPN